MKTLPALFISPTKRMSVWFWLLTISSRFKWLWCGNINMWSSLSATRPPYRFGWNDWNNLVKVKDDLACCRQDRHFLTRYKNDQKDVKSLVTGVSGVLWRATTQKSRCGWIGGGTGWPLTPGYCSAERWAFQMQSRARGTAVCLHAFVQNFWSNINRDGGLHEEFGVFVSFFSKDFIGQICGDIFFLFVLNAQKHFYFFVC